MRVWLILSLSLIESVISGRCIAQNDDVPIYFESTLFDVIKAVNKESASNCSFIFITDTHVEANQMRSSYLIKRIIEQTKINKVIWGGDAICAYGKDTEIEPSWQKQTQLDSVVADIGFVYKIRGNHDFTIKENSKSDRGITYSQRKTAQMLLAGHPENVVLNASDPDACYYYFDDTKSHFRFIAFDTTDSIRDENIAWGTIYGVHDRQLQWIVDSAIATTPKGYDIILLSHVPFMDTFGARNVVYDNVCEVIDAVFRKSAGHVGNVYYDFRKLKKTSVLMCLSGHNHQDRQTYRNGCVHMVTACDAAYNDYKADPFVKDVSGRIKGTVNEQCFDCISIDRKKGIISVYRIGVGGNRFFHTNALKCKIGKSKRLRSSLRGFVEWHSYNASGNKYDGKWTLFNDVVCVDDIGNIICTKKGEAVVLAIDEKGNKELFNIIVK